MRGFIIITLFLLGFGIFFYPIVNNFLATKEHESIISEYKVSVSNLDDKQIEKEKEKVNRYNKQLIDSRVRYIDPFAEEKDEEVADVGNSYYSLLNIGPAIGSIDIPKINVHLPIYHGTSNDVLSRGVGHLENTSLPLGELGSHSVLTAHRGLPSSKLFRDLDKVNIGDIFYIHILDETLAYKVREIKVVLPNDTEWLQFKNDEDIVTLFTCDPYMINSHRLLVTGARIMLDEDEKVAVEAENNVSQKYIFIGLIIVLLIFLITLRSKKVRIDDET